LPRLPRPECLTMMSSRTWPSWDPNWDPRPGRWWRFSKSCWKCLRQ